jgi:hypothetical protein
MKTCSIENCKNPLSARGWCATHWARWRLYDDPLGEAKPRRVTRRIRARPSLETVEEPPYAEDWLPIAGMENRFEVSNWGRIRTLNTGFIRKLSLLPSGYLALVYHISPTDRRTRTLYAQRAVALTFIPNPHNFPEVNHKDGNKQNNHVDNLEWCDRKRNVAHAFANGLVAFGEARLSSKLSLSKVRQVREAYSASNHSYTDLAKRFKVTPSVIGDIVKNRTWREDHYKPYQERNI